MTPSDRIVLLVSLSFFFFSGTLVLAFLSRKSSEHEPSSKMVFTAVQEYVGMDPHLQTKTLSTICYSEGTFTQFINEQTRKHGVALLARGSSDKGEPVEIYAGSSDFRIYVRESRPDQPDLICQILSGKNPEIFGISPVRPR